MSHLAVLGGGSWGTALAVVLSPNFESVRIWARDPDLAREIGVRRENRRYLPGIRIPDRVSVSPDPAACLAGPDAGAELVLCAIPSAHMRAVISSVRAHIGANALVVSATKGLERDTLLRMSQVIAEAAPECGGRILALSGPSFAQEVALGLPTAVVLAGASETARTVQAAFARPHFRLYTSDDIIGVELGGALKNVVAIGAGMAAGLGLGSNAVAALITRGLAEITRLATRFGAQPRTLTGLAGIGDLVLTCTGELSRNRRLGIELSRGGDAPQVLQSSRATTEGVRTAAAAVQMGFRHHVELPIAEQVLAVLESARSSAEAIRQLMERSLKEE